MVLLFILLGIRNVDFRCITKMFIFEADQFTISFLSFTAHLFFSLWLGTYCSTCSISSPVDDEIALRSLSIPPEAWKDGVSRSAGELVGCPFIPMPPNSTDTSYVSTPTLLICHLCIYQIFIPSTLQPQDLFVFCLFSLIPSSPAIQSIFHYFIQASIQMSPLQSGPPYLMTWLHNVPSPHCNLFFFIALPIWQYLYVSFFFFLTPSTGM